MRCCRAFRRPIFAFAEIFFRTSGLAIAARVAAAIRAICSGVLDRGEARDVDSDKAKFPFRFNAGTKGVEVGIAVDITEGADSF